MTVRMTYGRWHIRWHIAWRGGKWHIRWHIRWHMGCHLICHPGKRSEPNLEFDMSWWQVYMSCAYVMRYVMVSCICHVVQVYDYMSCDMSWCLMSCDMSSDMSWQWNWNDWVGICHAICHVKISICHWGLSCDMSYDMSWQWKWKGWSQDMSCDMSCCNKHMSS